MADLSRAARDAVQTPNELAQVPQDATGGRRQPQVMLVNDVENDRNTPEPWAWVGVVAGIVAAGYWAIQLL